MRPLQEELLRIAQKHDCVQARGAVAMLEYYGRYRETEILLWVIESLAESNKRLIDLAIAGKLCQMPPVFISKEMLGTMEKP